MFVDNFWHLYHDNATLNRWTSRDHNLLGEFKSESRVSHLAPALPTCIPLTPEGQLSHPMQDQVRSFSEYRLADVVINGGDDEYLQALRRNEAPSTEAPFNRLPVFLWHRIVFEDNVKGHDMVQCSPGKPEGECRSHFVQMTEHSRAKYCRQKNEYSADFEPEVTCDGGRRLPSTAYPYCNRETAPVAIVSADCLISESGYSDGVISWNLVSLSAGGRVLAFNGQGRWQVPRGVQVFDYDELGCAGTAVYPGAPGHFFNEILPRLIHMDATLPPHIPLLWPDGDIPARILEAFKAGGLLSAGRTYVPTQSARLHRARRMYTYASEHDPGHTPLLTLLGHATLQSRIHRYVAGRAPAMHGGVVVLTRGQDGKSRSVANQQQLLDALAAALPGVTVDAFEPTGAMAFLEVARRVYPARLVAGPHGANLNNIFGARPGATLIEFGYAGGMTMPSDFFCLARNLGLRYYLVPSLSGEYGSPMQVDVADIVDVARGVFAAPP